MNKNDIGGGGGSSSTFTILLRLRLRPNIRGPTLHYVERDGKAYLFLKRVSGRTLKDAWPSLEKDRKIFYKNGVVEIIKDMAE
jgi:hypothetical protein